MAVILSGSSYVYIDIQSLSTEYNTGHLDKYMYLEIQYSVT